MKLFFAVLLCSAMGFSAIAAEIPAASFKDSLKGLPAVNRNDREGFKTPPSLFLGSDSIPAGGRYSTWTFYMPGGAKVLAGKRVLFRCRIKRTAGTLPLTITYRLNDAENKILAGAQSQFLSEKINEWESFIAPEFAIPAVRKLGNFNVLLVFAKSGEQKNGFLIDEPEFIEIFEDTTSTSAKHIATLGLDVKKLREPLNLIQAGRPVCTVVLPEKPSAVEDYAARELAEHIALACGSAPAIIRENEKLPTSGALLLVGGTVFAKTYSVAPDQLPRESFVNARVGHSVILSGGDGPDISKELILSRAPVSLGTLYAVYDFLENVFCVRWYWPGDKGRVVPEQKELALDSFYKTGKPEYSTRALFVCNLIDDEIPVNEGWKYLRRLRFGSAEGNPIGMHSFNKWPGKFGKIHPEYFALQPDGTRKNSNVQGGHVCMSNPEVVRETANEKTEFFKTSRDLFSPVMPGDSLEIFDCQCPECRAKIVYNKGQSTHSNAVWGFVNLVAAKVAKTSPGKYITCCAYGEYARRPDFSLQPNIAVTLCFPNPPSTANKDAWLQWLDEWKNSGARLYVWEYWRARCSRGVYGAPAMAMHSFREYFMLDRGIVQGRVLELCPNDTNGRSRDGWTDWIYDVPNLFTAARLMWNPDDDVDAELEKFYRDFYGPAAAAMREFYSELENAWAGKAPGAWDWNNCWNKTYPPAFVDRMMKLLRDSVRLAGDREPYRYRMNRTLQTFENFERNSRMFCSPSEAAKTTHPSVIRVPVCTGVPDFSSPMWTQAAVAEKFRDSFDVYEQKAKSEMRFLHDGKTLYVKINATYPRERFGKVVFAPGRGLRDSQLWNYEGVELFFSDRSSRRYQFIFSPDDHVADFLWEFDDSRDLRNTGAKWNAAKVRCKSRRNDDGWEMLCAVPLDEMTFSDPWPDGGLRVNFTRNHFYQNGREKVWEQSCFWPTYGSYHDLEKHGRMYLEH